MRLSYNTRRTQSLAIFVLAALFISLSGCQKELSFENAGPPVVQAKGLLKDANGDCMPASVHGTWYNGVTPGDTNYVEVTVNVTRAGHYNISTGLVNGVSLADSGTFDATGLQTVRLKATGKFINIGSSYFTNTFDTTTCLFNIDVQDSTGTGLGGNNGGGNTGGGTVTVALNKWTFTANNHVYSGVIAGASIYKYLGTQLIVSGLMKPTATDTVWQVTVQFPGSDVALGTYPTSDAGTNFSFIKGNTNGDVILVANALADPVVKITITKYDAGAKTIEGTFSGDSYNFNGDTVPITNGQFKAQLL